VILRSLTKHVKDQNWFAVGLDFAIVVIGVFIGMQVANWNAGQLDRQREAVVLERLAADFNVILSDVAAHDEIMKKTIRLLSDVAVASQEIDSVADVEMIAEKLTEYRLTSRPTNSPMLIELLNSGELNLIRSAVVREALASWAMFMEQLSVSEPIVIRRLEESSKAFHDVKLLTDTTEFKEKGAYRDPVAERLRSSEYLVATLHLISGFESALSWTAGFQSEAEAVVSAIEAAR
jgi:hypothetical protein